MVGAAGFVSSEDPHVMGAEGVSLWKVSQSGDTAAARALQAKILRMKNALGDIGTAPASMKAAMNILGRPGGHVRAPLLDLDAAETDRVRAALDDLGLLVGLQLGKFVGVALAVAQGGDEGGLEDLHLADGVFFGATTFAALLAYATAPLVAQTRADRASGTDPL